jgi:tRNA U34 2-thiouridine synthase MnmA/TrmU
LVNIKTARPINFTPTPCIRCGKLRIFKKSWSEKTGNSPIITHVLSVCPDKACQKILDEEFRIKDEKRKALALKRAK